MKRFKSLALATVSIVGLTLLATSAQAQTIINPGFERDFAGWREIDPSGSGVAISEVERRGTQSAKITTRIGHRIVQTIDVVPNADYVILVYIRGDGRLRVTGAGTNQSRNRRSADRFAPTSVSYNTGDSNQLRIILEQPVTTNDARFDDVRIICADVKCLEPAPTPEPEPVVTNAFNLDPNAEPWENFDLDDWALDSPEGRTTNPCQSRRVDEDEWDEVPGTDTHNYFFTHTDGGMRFVSPVGGSTTSSSCNSGFPRSELREMLRRGNTSISTTGVNPNNWALGYQPSGGNYGGRNGVLTATLRVNEVTTTGEGLHPGRTIIGQIHADNDEPLRLYYRKLPGEELGCIYAESEIRDGNDVTFNMIGNERCENPSVGIALDELFSYEIINDDEDIIVRIRRGDRDGEIIATTTIDLNQLNSGYDRSDEWMYFKAGAYTQNNTGDPDDRDVITFYRLENTHDEN